MEIGNYTSLPKLVVTWPHQVRIGSKCVLEEKIYFKFDGIWQTGPSIIIGDNSFIGINVEFNIRQKIIIGDNCLIAAGCKFIDHDHEFSSRNILINAQNSGVESPIFLDNDVWLGANVIVLKGVKIERGSIVAAGSIVNKSIPSYEIWAGIPARKISNRPI
jgi:acetyltransferase-like isoleucine patch superfamily enzyme